MCLYTSPPYDREAKTVKHTVKLPTSESPPPKSYERPGRKEGKQRQRRGLARFRPQGSNFGLGLWTLAVVQLTRAFYKRAIERESQGQRVLLDIASERQLSWFARLETRVLMWAQKRKFVDHQVKLATSNAANLRDVIGELPAWVKFGDVESGRWLNSVLEKVWPCLNSAISQTVRDVVEPILEGVKPSFITYIGFTDFDLGNTAPEVTGIKCLPSDGDEVKDLDFASTVRVVFKKLVPQFPCFSTLEASPHPPGGVCQQAVHHLPPAERWRVREQRARAGRVAQQSHHRHRVRRHGVAQQNLRRYHRRGAGVGTNHMQDVRIYSHDGPIGRGTRGYILMMDKSYCGLGNLRLRQWQTRRLSPRVPRLPRPSGRLGCPGSTSGTPR
eukprot:1192694-Prorocentrum_minimum.AAC.2